MRPRTIYLALILALAGNVCPLTGGELGDVMRKMTARLDRECMAKLGDSASVTIAVFPFSADRDLVRKRVNFAAGEVTGKYLLETGHFSLVERTDLETVLKEQALGQSGAIGNASAVKVGSLLGCRLVLLGSISRPGALYQVSVRVVDTGTGEVLSMDYAEIPAKVFDREAAPYMAVLAPDRQTIGLYFAAGFSPSFSSGKISSYTIAGQAGGIDYSVTVEPVQVDRIREIFASGLGVRYFPWKHFMAEAGYVFNGFSFKDEVIARMPDTTAVTVSLSSSYITGSLNGVWPVRPSVRVFGGMGVDYYFMNFGVNGRKSSNVFVPADTASSDQVEIICEIGGGQIEYDQTTFHEDTDAEYSEQHAVPFIRAGCEVRPQSRLGIMLYGKYLLNRRDILQEIDFGATESYYTPGGGWDVGLDQYNGTPVFKPVFPRYAFGITTTLYF